MNEEDVKNMIYDIMEAADYDTAKQLMPETAEDPDDAKDFMNMLVDIAISHLDKLS